MKIKFKKGDKVLVASNWNWPNECRGTIDGPPEFAIQLAADNHPWQSIHRLVKGRKGLIEFYWVNFDEPQRDGDGDGPYRGGEIEAEYLSLINKEP